MIAVACSDGGVSVFNGASGNLLASLRTPTGGVVSSAAFSPDGTRIVATYKGSGGIRIWNTELATASPAKLEHLAEERVTSRLPASVRQGYLAHAAS
jgi:WD40 repeat protein